MLVQVSIRDIVLIDRLDIDFARGLSALTGETGAGKSILLDALSLALGGRGDAGLVRHGAPQGQVTAVFDPPAGHPARLLLAANAIDSDDALILRRVQTADGRSRVFINDQPASVTLLRDIGRLLVELHGQHDERALVDAATHRELVDAFAGLGGEATLVRNLWRIWRESETELDRHRARVAAAAREADYLRAAVKELGELAPEEGEEAALAEKRAVMMRAEKVAVEIADAAEVLSGANAPTPALASLLRRLERKATEAPGLLDDVTRALDEALIALESARAGVEAAMRAAEFDPKELEKAEERLFALRAASRKHSVAADALAGLRERMAADLAALDAGEERLAALEKSVGAARLAFDAAAAALSTSRRAGGEALAMAVMAELPALKLDRAEFFIDIASDAANRQETGVDTIEFRVRTNPGSRPGPLMKVASGGELSRFLLALKVALADKGSAPTLVFDEIDAGAGGAVADAIGQRLARLAEKVQVLTVTHAPQVAARARSHFLITKAADGPDRMATRVALMDDTDRAEEIARMLAGATITEEARRAADKLLAGAG
ncbi:MAG: DNA repair protein RecN [Phyllobacteriaceae bacterium]|nr:DNA repair protein RecN [Phyllobacteriaceae bacterium]